MEGTCRRVEVGVRAWSMGNLGKDYSYCKTSELADLKRPDLCFPQHMWPGPLLGPGRAWESGQTQLDSVLTTTSGRS